MMFLRVLVLGVAFIASAKLKAISPQNVITVPPNCPIGQELIDGECRDIWKSGSVTPAPLLQMYDSRNMVTVPTNCPPGQQLINGQCRDIWKNGALSESDLIAKILEEIWTKLSHYRNRRQSEENVADIIVDTLTSKNIISIPNQCPKGYKPDALGICRKIF